jgi:biotin-dependent carboxylase-like uncharacterized protein
VTALTIVRAGPLATLQDRGRYGMLAHGISASGPMDRSAYDAAGALLETAGEAAIEFTSAGLCFTADGPLHAACAGGDFVLTINGNRREWPARIGLDGGETVDISPGASGTYGYLRFDREIEVPELLGSRSTNLMVGLGGYRGRALRAGDLIAFGGPGAVQPVALVRSPSSGPIRVIWGLHADQIPKSVRDGFASSPFLVSNKLDRMGVRLEDPAGVFDELRHLSLVSDAIVPGDIQILGDGTPIVLMRDHQPTGGYPRIATIVAADFDRFAQSRPGTEIRFQPVTLEHAR